jgi:uncharacterized protein
MRPSLSSFLSGLLFALGLGVSGMTDPARVIAFLDISGEWDFRLGLVMAGAVAVYALAHPLIRGRGRPLFAGSFPHLCLTRVDGPLLAGSALFGVGWGLGGFCPGPALTSLASGAAQALVFVPAMFLGMYLVQLLRVRDRTDPVPPAQPMTGAPVLASDPKP